MTCEAYCIEGFFVIRVVVIGNHSIASDVAIVTNMGSDFDVVHTAYDMDELTTNKDMLSRPILVISVFYSDAHWAR